MAKNRRSRSNRRKSIRTPTPAPMPTPMMMGGSGAADHAIAVYGGIGQQHAISDTNNAIHENASITPSSTLNVQAASMTGGSKCNLRGGARLAIPAALLYGQPNMKMKSMRRKQRKHKRTFRRK